MLQLTESEVLMVVQQVLSAGAMFVGGPVGLALAAVANIIPSVYAAVQSGGQPDAIVKAIQDSLVKASDVDMKIELGADS